VGLAGPGARAGRVGVAKGSSLPWPARRRGSETQKASPTHVAAVSESFSDRGSIPRASIKTRDTAGGEGRGKGPRLSPLRCRHTLARPTTRNIVDRQTLRPYHLLKR